MLGGAALEIRPQMAVAWFDKSICGPIASSGHIRGEIAVVVDIPYIDPFDGAHDGKIVSRIEPPFQATVAQPIENGAVGETEPSHRVPQRDVRRRGMPKVQARVQRKRGTVD